MRDLESLRREYPAMQLETYSITDDRGTEFNALLSSRFRIPQRDRLIAPSLYSEPAGGLMRDRLTSGNLKALLEDSRRQPESGHPSGWDQARVGHDGAGRHETGREGGAEHV